ncbi:GNAT family N-acetyltransferase [Halapricum salinum]|uniref:N-acetyltransferase n=1 Tax=Halapricum salinum TaxID=1457250 RepID=A0A4D6HDA6_9EURY|nr:N-acetyltransferase [Halapricum salinum]QCC52064.1 N-acetyltransferase [Halapricum salinum]
MVDIEPTMPDDEPAIERLLRAAFEDGVEAELAAVLRDGEDLRAGCSMVAREDGVVGYAAVSNASVVGSPGVEIAVLGPVAVAPEHQDEGTGTRLVRATLRACKRSGCDAVVLEGDPAFYERFGFEAATAYGLESDLDPPAGAFQVWSCWPGALDGVSGIVRHPAPFHAL